MAVVWTRRAMDLIELQNQCRPLIRYLPSLLIAMDKIIVLTREISHLAEQSTNQHMRYVRVVMKTTVMLANGQTIWIAVKARVHTGIPIIRLLMMLAKRPVAQTFRAFTMSTPECIVTSGKNHLS